MCLVERGIHAFGEWMLWERGQSRTSEEEKVKDLEQLCPEDRETFGVQGTEL